MAPRTTPAPMPREPPVIRIFLFSSRRISPPSRFVPTRHAHAHAVLRAGADIVPDLFVLADDLEIPARHDRRQGDAHLAVGQVRARAAAVTTAEREELERAVGALEKPFGPEAVRL